MKTRLLVYVNVTRQRLREIGWPLESEKDSWPPGGYLRRVYALPLASVCSIHEMLQNAHVLNTLFLGQVLGHQAHVNGVEPAL